MRVTFAKWYDKLWRKAFGAEGDGGVVHRGVSEESRIKRDVTTAEKQMLPFDDVDEWLAIRLREYDKALKIIEAKPRNGNGGYWKYGKTVTQTFSIFITRSLHNSWYRRLLQANVNTSYTLAHAKALRAQLATA